MDRIHRTYTVVIIIKLIDGEYTKFLCKDRYGYLYCVDVFQCSPWGMPRLQDIAKQIPFILRKDQSGPESYRLEPASQWYVGKSWCF